MFLIGCLISVKNIGRQNKKWHWAMGVNGCSLQNMSYWLCRTLALTAKTNSIYAENFIFVWNVSSKAALTRTFAGNFMSIRELFFSSKGNVSRKKEKQHWKKNNFQIIYFIIFKWVQRIKEKNIIGILKWPVG